MPGIDVGVIRGPGVVHGNTVEPAEHPGVVDALLAAFGVAGDQGVLVSAGAMHPVQLAGHPQPGLVESGHLSLGHTVTHHIEELVQPVGRPLRHGRHGAFGDRGAEQFGQRLRGALLRQELPNIEVEDDRGDPRPVLHRRCHTLGSGAAGRRPTRTAACDQLMLGHLHRHRRQVEHLPPFHTHLRRARQGSAAPRTRAGLVPHPLVRIIDQSQRRPRMPRLATRLAPALTPQRFRSGLDERRVRRRRLRRVPAVLPQPPRQLSNLSLKPHDLLSLRHNQSSKLLIRRTRPLRHHTMIDEPTGRSSRHAVRHLTSYQRSSGPSLTSGYVVRLAQAVLQPPPTPTRHATHFPDYRL